MPYVDAIIIPYCGVEAPPPPAGAAQVPSALRKFVVPPPEEGVRPFKLD